MKKKLLVLNGALCLVLVLLIGMGVNLKKGTWSERKSDSDETNISENNPEEAGPVTTCSDISGEIAKETERTSNTTEESLVPTGETTQEETQETTGATEETEPVATKATEGEKETPGETKATEEINGETSEPTIIPGENELEPGGEL